MDLTSALIVARKVEGYSDPTSGEQASIVLAASVSRVQALVQHYRNVGWVGLREVVKALDGPE